MARVYTGDGVFKVRKNNEHREREGERKGVRVIMYCHTHAQTLRIPVGSTIEDVVRMYFKVETDLHLQWTLVEMSLDETGTIEKNKS